MPNKSFTSADAAVFSLWISTHTSLRWISTFFGALMPILTWSPLMAAMVISMSLPIWIDSPFFLVSTSMSSPLYWLAKKWLLRFIVFVVQNDLFCFILFYIHNDWCLQISSAFFKWILYCQNYERTHIFWT